MVQLVFRRFDDCFCVFLQLLSTPPRQMSSKEHGLHCELIGRQVALHCDVRNRAASLRVRHADLLVLLVVDGEEELI